MKTILVPSMIPASGRAEQLRLRIRQLLVKAGASPHRGWTEDRKSLTPPRPSWYGGAV